MDDHEVVREGLKFLFSDARPEWEICGEAANSEDAVKKASTLKPDVIVLDISLPGASGLEAAMIMRAVGIDSPILIFTTHQSERLGDEVRAVGAQGYVTKSQAFRDLVHAIDVVLSGGNFFGSPSPETPDPETPKSGGRTFCMGLRPGWQT